MPREFIGKERKYELNFKAFNKCDKISSENKKLVNEFGMDCFAKGLSKNRITKYYTMFKLMLTKIHPGFSLKKASKKDIKDVIAKINQSEYSEWTKHDLKVAVKYFYKDKIENTYPDKVVWIKTTMKNNKKKLPEDLLERDEVERLVKACQNNRDKAIISVLYEGGMRASELGSLRIKHVKFNENGTVITMPEGKTGSRRILLIESGYYLRFWLRDHPTPEDSNAPLWTKIEQQKCKNCGRIKRTHDKKESNCKKYVPEVERMSYDNIRVMIRRKAVQSGVDPDKVNLHNFRHSRATELAKHLTEAEMCEYFGWVQGSDMTSTYVHLSGRDVDKAIMRMHGIKPEGEERKKARTCPRCGNKNPAGMRFCGRCQQPLDIKVAMDYDKEKDEILNLSIKQILSDPNKAKELGNLIDNLQIMREKLVK